METVPHSKNSKRFPDSTLEDSIAWKNARKKGQGYLYVNQIKDNGELVCNEVEGWTGDCFSPSDLTHYVDQLENRVKELEENLAFVKESYDMRVRDWEKERMKLEKKVTQLEKEKEQLKKLFVGLIKQI